MDKAGASVLVLTTTLCVVKLLDRMKISSLVLLVYLQDMDEHCLKNYSLPWSLKNPLSMPEVSRSMIELLHV